MKSNKTWTVAMIAVISVIRIGMGYYTAIFGPTLLYLSKNVNVTVTAISTVFTARAVGTLIGAIFGGVLKRLAGPEFRHLLPLGISVGVLGLMDVAVPWIKDFWILVCVIIVGGIMYGYLDAGLQAQLLQLWGEKASRPHIQLFHFMFSVGAFIAPFIASPFLTMANSVDSDDGCPHDDADLSVESTVTTTTSFNSTNQGSANKFDFNPIGWAYIIAGLWLVPVACLTVLLSLLDVESRVSKSVTESGSSSEKRADEPLGNVIWLLIAVVVMYFFFAPIGNLYYNFVYSVTLCSDLSFTPSKASTVTSVYWAGLGLGRLSGVVISRFFKPQTIIIACIIASITEMSIICIWGESTEWIVWGVTALYGYSTSLFYPTGVSWVSQYTSVSGIYLFVFNIGNACGSLSMSPLAGYLFDLNPFNVMYLVIALVIGNAISFSFAIYAAKRHVAFLERNTRETEIKQNVYLHSCDDFTGTKL